jgi:hypothetical protein
MMYICIYVYVYVYVHVYVYVYVINIISVYKEDLHTYKHTRIHMYIQGAHQTGVIAHRIGTKLHAEKTDFVALEELRERLSKVCTYTYIHMHALSVCTLFV